MDCIDKSKFTHFSGENTLVPHWTPFDGNIQRVSRYLTNDFELDRMIIRMRIVAGHARVVARIGSPGPFRVHRLIGCLRIQDEVRHSIGPGVGHPVLEPETPDKYVRGQASTP